MALVCWPLFTNHRACIEWQFSRQSNASWAKELAVGTGVSRWTNITALKSHKRKHWHLVLEGVGDRGKGTKDSCAPHAGNVTFVRAVGGHCGICGMVRFTFWKCLPSSKVRNGKSHSRKERKHLTTAVVEPKSTRMPRVPPVICNSVFPLHTVSFPDSVTFQMIFLSLNFSPFFHHINPFTLLSSVLLSCPSESPRWLLRSGSTAFCSIRGLTFLNNDCTWGMSPGLSAVPALKLHVYHITLWLQDLH